MSSDLFSNSKLVLPLVVSQQPQCFSIGSFSLLVLQVYPVGPQRQPAQRGQLCTLPQSAARVRAVPLGGRHPVPQPVAARRDRV